MRSKISKKILSETSQETKDKVNEYANKLVLSGVVKSFCDCGGYASNKKETNRGKCDNCKKEKI